MNVFQTAQSTQATQSVANIYAKVRPDKQQAQPHAELLIKQQKTRLDTDEKTLAILDAKQNNQPSISRENTSYDQPSKQNQTAVAAYQAINHEQDRQSIQQSFGVDLFA